MDLENAPRFEIESYHRLIPTDDRREEALAYDEKRKPKFTGR